MGSKPRDLKPRRSQCVRWASIRSWPFFGCGQSLPQSNHGERRSKLKSIRKDAPTDRRGTNKEAELGSPDHHVRLGLGSRSAQAHKHDRNRGNRRGRHGVHRDAQLAVIGVGLVGMQMRNLGHRQHCQQNQAKHRHRRHKAGPGAAFPEPLWPESLQTIALPLLFYRRVHKIGRFRPGEVVCRAVFPPILPPTGALCV